MKRSGEVRFSKTSLVLIGLAIITVAFLGAVAGRWFVDWRQDQAYNRQVQAKRRGQESLLKPGDLFPAVEVINHNGKSENTAALAHRQKTLVLLMSVGCDPCTEAIQTWKRDVDELPSDLQAFGICQGEYEYADVYKNKTGFPFPVYCDTSHVLPAKYGLDVFPSVVGLAGDGRVAFLREGRHADITLLHAYDLIAHADSTRQQ
jgi:peroxiredoxin